MADQIYDFAGVPGIKKKKVKGIYATSPSGFLRRLKDFRVVSASGDHGAVMLWVDDTKPLRGNFQRWHQTIDEQIFSSQAAAREWLKEWLPRMKVHP